MKKLAGILSLVIFLDFQIAITSAQPFKQYEQTWESLSKHPVPEWFQDAKFGIYAHLGVYCVPAHGNEWYPRNMYMEKDAANPNSTYSWHQKHFGDQNEFGYKDFIPMFKMESFDPAEWAELYARSGARFAGPVAEHHDGFSMWASKVNRWNAGEMGPRRDIVGELVREIRKRDMKVITSFHHAFNIQGYYPVKEGWDTADPEYADFYGKLDSDKAHSRWLAKLKEVIDAYQPDQIWFDFGLAKIPDKYKQEFAAYYYNKEAQWNKPVIITRKGDHLPEGVGVLDIERGRMKDSSPALWQTDDSTASNSWCWVQGLNVKPPVEVIHVLIDIVSKNGVLLLNVCPKADGTISDDQKKILLEMGAWLKVNGEAIYATRPWDIYGQGPTIMKKGGGFLPSITYTAQDIRFTRSKDGKNLYAICLGWPEKSVTLDAVHIKQAGPAARVQLLGSKAKAPYEIDDQGKITIQTTSISGDLPCKYAYVFKLSGFDLEADPFSKAQTISLKAAQAVLDGDTINLESKNGSEDNIGFWDRTDEGAHWLVKINEPGSYLIKGSFASLAPSKLKLSIESQELAFEVPATGGWAKVKQVDIGTLQLAAPGIYHLKLYPQAVGYNSVNLWQIDLAKTK